MMSGGNIMKNKVRIYVDGGNRLKKVVFELLNHLLPFNVNIHVKVIYNVSISSDDIKQCMILLNRLDKHKLIELENLTNRKDKQLHTLVCLIKN